MLSLSKLKPHKHRDGKLLLIDGDYITFNAASSADGRVYKVDGQEFKYKKDAVHYCEDNHITDEIVLEYHPEPVENALHNAKLIIHGILDGCNSDNYQIYVHDGGNYRKDIYPEYKANRDGMRRPHHLGAVKDYLVDRWNAELVYDQETDDVLGIEQMRAFNYLFDTHVEHNEPCLKDTMICTHDKDLDCIPGWHYRIKYGKPSDEGETYFVTEEEAWRNFFTQCLVGDSTDNIPGLYKITGQKASKAIKEGLNVLIDPGDMWEYVQGYWGEHQEELMRSASLLWIRREPGQQFEKVIGSIKQV